MDASNKTLDDKLNPITNSERIEVLMGAGCVWPGGFHSALGKTYKPGTRYICYDTMKEYEDFKDRITLKPGVELRCQDARHTGLPNDYADEVHIHNVFTDPEFPLIKRDFLNEAVRIVKPNGAIYIGGTVTPEECPLEKVLRITQAPNLKVEVLIDAKGRKKIAPQERQLLVEHMSERWKEYDTFESHSYLVRLTKPSSNEGAR